MRIGFVYSSFLVLVLILFSGCGKKCSVMRERAVPLCTDIADDLLPEPGKPITIFVHGTRSFTAILPLMPYGAHAMRSHCGIVRVAAISSWYILANTARALHGADPLAFPLENMYLYGWSGTLTFKARYDAAKRLYAFIEKIRSDARFENTPITIITHSHGGNVALNIAPIAEKAGVSQVLVDRLILLACPVQTATAHCATSPIFKMVFNIYSTGDMIQVLDPQGLYGYSARLNRTVPLISERLFDSVATVVQVSIRNKSYALSHIDFVTPRFMRKLPMIVDTLSDPKKRDALPKRGIGIYAMRIPL